MTILISKTPRRGTLTNFGILLISMMLSGQTMAAYNPAFCQLVAGTLNIHWENQVAPNCTGIEFTDGVLSAAADGSVVLNGTSVSGGNCIVTAAYEFTLSADTTQLVGSDTANSVPMTLTRGPGEDCFVGTWTAFGDIFEAHIWADAFSPALANPVPASPLWLLGVMAGLLSVFGIRQLRNS